MNILSGLKIVEISEIGAASETARHFANWGADVVVLESLNGNPVRDLAPHYESDGQQRSAAWDWLSRGKKIKQSGKLEAQTFCKNADLLIIEASIVSSILGLSATELNEWSKNHANVLLLSPFAVDGPLDGYMVSDLGLMARGGWMDNLQSPGREPIRPSFDLIYRVVGALAFFIGLTILRASRQQMRYQFAEISMQGVAASMLVSPWMIRSMTGADRPFWAVADESDAWPMSNILPCKDGWFGCAPLTPKHWEGMCHMFGIPDVLNEPGGREMSYRMEHAVELWRRVKPALMSMTRAELMVAAQSHGITAAPICTIEERLDDVQLNARGFFQKIEMHGKTIKVPRVSYLFDGKAAKVPGDALEETREIFTSKKSKLDGGGKSDLQPFDGIRILDLSHFWAGPYATLLLGTLGADVIKVESMTRPDAYRYTIVDTSLDKCWEKGALWNDTNSERRGIAVDLHHPKGREILLELVRKVDVVISNFSNRVMPSLGLDDDTLRSMNDQLIVVTMPGYGPDGPWGDYIGYGIAFEQLASCASMTGYLNDTPKIPSGFCDPMSGTLAAAAIELALRERESTGKGLSVQVPQCESVDALFGPEYIAVQHGVPVFCAQGNRHEYMVPHNTYQVAGSNEWISLAVDSDEKFTRLMTALGAPEVATNSRFKTLTERKRNEHELDEIISSLVVNEPLLGLEERLQAVGVMACRVTKGSRLPEDASLQYFGLFQEMSRSITGTHPYRRIPVKLRDMDDRFKRPPPLLGQHTREVLQEYLGINDEMFESLLAEGVIGERLSETQGI